MARVSFLAATILLATETAALAQAGRLGGGNGGVDVSLTRIITALILCLMLAGLTAVALKRSGGKFDLAGMQALFTRMPAPIRRIDVVETRRISQHADVCLLRCDGREYLILCAANQQTVLSDAPAGERAA